jgi:hypothetical protein
MAASGVTVSPSAATDTPTLAWRPSPGDESHICATGEVNTVAPVVSLASRVPAAPAETVRPLVASPKCTWARAGFAAAAGAFTMRISEKPSDEAVMLRSTPGMTSG